MSLGCTFPYFNTKFIKIHQNSSFFNAEFMISNTEFLMFLSGTLLVCLATAKTTDDLRVVLYTVSGTACALCMHVIWMLSVCIHAGD